MSTSVDGNADVYREQVRRARKLHTCSACAAQIRPGDYYCAVSIVYDGTFDFLKRCGSCQRTHEHLRGLCDPRDHVWPDERLNCGDSYQDAWDDEPPDDIAALPLLSADERGALLRPRRGVQSP